MKMLKAFMFAQMIQKGGGEKVHAIAYARVGRGARNYSRRRVIGFVSFVITNWILSLLTTTDLIGGVSCMK